MDNFNLTKVYKEYYSARLKPACFPAGAGKFITVVGRGEPGGDDFQEKVSALYQMGYGIRAKYKGEGRAVPPREPAMIKTTRGMARNQARTQMNWDFFR